MKQASNLKYLPVALALSGVLGACSEGEDTVREGDPTNSAETILIQNLTVLISSAAGAVLAGYLFNKRNKHNSEVEVDVQKVEDTELSDDSWKSDPLAYMKKIGDEQKITQEKMVFMYEFLLEWIESLSTEKRNLDQQRIDIQKLQEETDSLNRKASDRFIKAENEWNRVNHVWRLATIQTEKLGEISRSLKGQVCLRDPALTELINQGKPSQGSSSQVSDSQAEFVAGGGDITVDAAKVFSTKTPSTNLTALTDGELGQGGDAEEPAPSTGTAVTDGELDNGGAKAAPITGTVFPSASIFLRKTSDTHTSTSEPPTPVSGVNAVPQNATQGDEAEPITTENSTNTEETPTDSTQDTEKKPTDPTQDTSFEADPMWENLFN
ncbi:MAG: hypothetical protein RBS56_04735 [Candidatus Gracilibacteria bacterium]|jgi:hypothetical protein|nr:hypothetical protein [Candidatus Gracilibacteria bacterium]